MELQNPQGQSHNACLIIVRERLLQIFATATASDGLRQLDSQGKGGGVLSLLKA